LKDISSAPQYTLSHCGAFESLRHLFDSAGYSSVSEELVVDEARMVTEACVVAEALEAPEFAGNFFGIFQQSLILIIRNENKSTSY
jgi:hypothetical protein